MNKHNNIQELRGVLCALLGGALWGFSGTCGQYLFQRGAVDAQWLSAVRMLAAGLLLLVLGFAGQGRAYAAIWRDKRDAVRLVAFSLLGLIGCQYFYMVAISHSNSGTATALQYTGQAMILIYSCLLARRLPTKLEGLGVLLAIGGTFLLATHGDPTNLAITPAALVWGLVSALGLALYTLLPGRLTHRYGTMVLLGWGMVLAGVVLCGLLRPWERPVQLDLPAFAALAGGTILLGTVGGYTLYLRGVAAIGGVRASMIAWVEPVCAMVCAAGWLGTPFVAMDYIGMGMILATVLLLARESARRGG